VAFISSSHLSFLLHSTLQYSYQWLQCPHVSTCSGQRDKWARI
jgi:hypothetical protein